MSIATSFDTHQFIKQMMATGFTEEQAEIQVRLLFTILDNQLSTKADMATMDLNVLELKRDIREIDARIQEINARIQELNVRIQEIDAKVEVTKAELQKDLESLRMTLQKEMESLKVVLQLEFQRDIASVKRDIESAKVESIKWTAGMFAAQTALIIGALFTMLKTSQPNPPPILYHAPQEMRLPAPTPPAPTP